MKEMELESDLRRDSLNKKLDVKLVLMIRLR